MSERRDVGAARDRGSRAPRSAWSATREGGWGEEVDAADGRGLEEARRTTRWLTHDLTDAAARGQAHPALSPLGWHLGHVAWQEEVWLHRRTFGRGPLEPGTDRIFDPAACPKAKRSAALPPLEAIHSYAAQVRERSLELLERPPKAPALDLDWVVRFLANHERQHAETMAAARIAAGLHLAPSPETSGGGSPGVAEADQPNGIATALGEGVGLGQRSGWVEVPGGSFAVGADDPEGWDNERSQHVLTAEQFRVSRAPVRNGEWLEFLEMGGYRRDDFWSPAGRMFRDRHRLEAPLHWERIHGAWWRRGLRGLAPVHPDHPVAHVSWYEAEAFATFRGARLPTEAEWERVAGWDAAAGEAMRWPSGPKCDANSNVWMRSGDTTPVGAGPSRSGLFDLEGNVWEWTASPFLAYPGFTPGPYRRYSEPWFGPAHRVLRGGCYLTHPHMTRAAFRNWLEPETRVYPTGLRLAASP